MRRPQSVFWLLVLSLSFLLTSSISAVENEARPLRLGLGLAEETSLDHTVVVVRSIEPESSAAALGLQAGDHVVSLAGKPVTDLASVADISQTLKVGDALTATIERAGVRQELTTTAVETPRPAQLSARTKELDDAMKNLRADVTKDRALRLEEILLLLHQVQEELPKTAAAFKVQYPQGRFHIAISIDIQSDVNAAQPAALGDAAEKTPTGTPAASPASVSPVDAP